jgi:hypothetical protein
MKTQNIIIIALVAMIAIFGTNYFAMGVTTLGLEKVEFKSSDPILNGDVWVISFAEGGLAQSYYGSVPARTGDVVKTNKDFSLDVTNSNQYCEYPMSIDYDALRIYRMGYKEIPLTALTSSSRESYCLGYAGTKDNIVSISRPSDQVHFYCFYKVPVTSNIAFMNDESLKFSTDFRMTIGDSSYRNSISTYGDDNKDISNTIKFSNVGYVKWVGNLVTGDVCPSQQNKIGSYYNGVWHTLSKSRYDTYKNYYDANFRSFNTVNVLSESMSRVDRLNDLANAALQTDKVQNSYFTGSEKDGKLVLSLQNPVQIPTFVAYVSANEVTGLGVYQPVGKPSVVTVTDTAFKTGETGYVNAIIENVGNERGGFYTSVSCDGYVSMVGSPKYNTLNPGESVKVTIPVTGSVAQNTCTNCQVTTEVLSVKDSRSFQTCVDIQKVCEPNTKVCVDGDQWTCKADGSGYDIVENHSDCRTDSAIDDSGDDFFGKLLEDFLGMFGETISTILYYVIFIVMILVVLWLLSVILPVLIPAIIGRMLRR